ncbi:MAG: hypothetical protein ABI433_04655 [Burkholderiaceae bacterium]
MNRIVTKDPPHDGANKPPFVRLFGPFAALKFPNNRFHSGTVNRPRLL